MLRIRNESIDRDPQSGIGSKRKDPGFTQVEIDAGVGNFHASQAAGCEQYVASGECDDKAGAYAIQGRAAQFVRSLRGSFSGVMGLPLYETAQLLERMGAQRERRTRP